MLAVSTETLDYADIFNQRADDYHAAMHAFPMARHAEFATLFSAIPLGEKERIIDIPSGGGYLQNHIKTDALVQCYDFSSGFAHEGGPHIKTLDANADEWEIGLASRVVSLAGLHHFDDPLEVIGRFYRHVNQGGVMHIADVAAGSAPGYFLNGFVDRYNPQGHEGKFLPAQRFAWPSHWHITRIREESIPWVFPDVKAMVWFCCKLFGVPLANAEAMRHELATTIGYTEFEKKCQLHWSLLYVDVLRPLINQQ